MVSPHAIAPGGNAAASKPQRAYDYLRSRIDRGEYAPRERLLAGPIATELGFSIVPVREAIQRLAAEGFVTIEHNVGARIASFDAEAYRQGMEALAVMDGSATAWAAPYVTAESFARAQQLNGQMERLLDDFDSAEYSALNTAFHATLYGHCPNGRLLDLVRTEWARFAGLRDPAQVLSAERARESVAEHAGILALIESGAEAHEIELAARTHVLKTLDAEA